MKRDFGVTAPAELHDKEAVIWQSLMTAMVEHQLPPGSKLPEEALADVFGISRTGIRKVLTRLATVQMITMLPGRGAFVAMPDVEESKAIFQTRRCLNAPTCRTCLNISRPRISSRYVKLSSRKKKPIATATGLRQFGSPRRSISSCRLFPATPC
jgi:DNA-binding GntR family transcriptional regulator